MAILRTKSQMRWTPPFLTAFLKLQPADLRLTFLPHPFHCLPFQVGTWNQFMQFWATSGLPEAHDKMEALLQGMADDGITPDVVTWSIFAKHHPQKRLSKKSK